MLRRLVTSILASALLGGTMVALSAAPANAAEPWRLTTDCTQDGILKLRWKHDYNQNNRERLQVDAYVYTAVGFQTWDYKTKVNGKLWTQGAQTTDGTGNLRNGLNALAAAPGQALNITSIAFDATNRTTGERCRITAAVPPIALPNKVDLDPWYAQGFCSDGTPWKLRMNRHVRANGQEKFDALVRFGPDLTGHRLESMGYLDGVWTGGATAGASSTPTFNGAASVIGARGAQLDLSTARITFDDRTTGETCDISMAILPLA